MITLTEAFELIEKEVSRLPSRLVSITEAVGCELREEIISPINVPPFANSAMDGYAIRFDDLKGSGPWHLSVQDVIAAGDMADAVLSSGNAAKIMTGAPMPKEADTVIRVEDIEAGNGDITIKNKPRKGDHVRPAGDDIKKGITLYKSGEKLNPVGIGVLASIGKATAKITPRPGVAVLSTGSELVNPGEDISGGQIYNSNDFIIKSLLKKDGLESPQGLTTSIDNVRDLYAALEGVLSENDLVIASGGVSMGDFDLIPEALKKLDGEILFHKVIVKPGKPVLFARVKGRWLLGLPGNPVSVFVGYHLYAKRIIAKLSGFDYSPRIGNGVLEENLPIKGDRHHYVGAWIRESKNGFIVKSAARQQSGRLYSIAGIDGFISVEGGTRVIEKGTEVDIEWLD